MTDKERERLGEKIDRLDKLKAAAWCRRAVVCPDVYCWSKPRPAAFMINLSGYELEKLFERGMYVYQKEKTEKVDGVTHDEFPEDRRIK